MKPAQPMKGLTDPPRKAPSTTRRVLPYGHPDAVYDPLRGLWIESDAAFARRILADRAPNMDS